MLPKKRTVGVDISIGSFDAHVATVRELALARTSAYVCCVNAHMCVEAHQDPRFAAVVNNADLATADGMPLLREVNRKHGLAQERVAGNDLLPALLAMAERSGVGVFFYGGKQDVLDKMEAKAAREYPALRIAGSCSPPFRALSEDEMNAHAAMINASGAGVVMVSLGCPKQERWMAAMRGKVNGAMLGLGGAFLLYAEVDTRAPAWMRNMSLEWLYRLALEPRRLWKRYLVTNTIFIRLLLMDRRQKG